MGKMSFRQIRLAKEISIAAMAERLGVHPNTYARWEKEPGTIPVSKAFEIAEILEASVDDIFLDLNSTKC